MRARRSTLLSSAALAASTLLLAPSASAHDALVGSQPSAEATVAKAPEQITLTFDEPVLGLGNRVSVKEPGGTTRTLTPRATGSIVSAPFTDAGNGRYEVTWRVTSEDGHPVSGAYSFTLEASGMNSSTASSPATSSSAGRLGTQSASPSPSSVTGPSTPTTNEPGDNEPLLVIGGAVLAALALAGAFVVARRRVHDDPR